MNRVLARMTLMVTLLFAGCNADEGEYVALATISRDGFARDAAAVRRISGQEVQVWGYVDHGNLYGDAAVKALLGDRWSGPGPDSATWRFDIKASPEDETGKSSAIHVANDAGRDEILKRFLADANQERPSKVYVTGRLRVFDAPSSDSMRTGFYLQVGASSQVLLETPGR